MYLPQQKDQLHFQNLRSGWNFFKDFSEKQLVGLFSCATDIKMEEDADSQIPHTHEKAIRHC